LADERKYREDEVGEIFALAASADGADLPAIADPEGLTLGELQAVGREVGLAPKRVAEAAATLDARADTLSHRASLGAPVSVGRVVELPRAATDREWQFLVAELRETFGAKGRVISHGDTREWTNGNLHAVLEQTEAGHRLRLGTYKSDAMGVIAAGAGGLGMALMFAVALVSKGKIGLELFLPGMMALAGGGAIVSNFFRLPKWANERARQMEHMAGRARALLEKPPLEKDPED